jgi:LCP family protein required for cell wall assembly
LSEFNLPDGRFGPAVRGGRPRRGPDWRRIGIILVSALAGFALLGAATFGALVWYGEQQLNKIVVEGREELDQISDPLNVLVVGSDDREGLTEEQLQALGTDDHGAHLTDTVMLLHLDPNREQVAVLSFPRDLLLTRCDGSRGRINAAYGIGEREGIGGPTCMVQTVSDFTGIPVHHYVEVDFAGFIDVIDTLGGVDMYFEEPLRDVAAGLDVPAGCVHLDGVRALGFVRARKDLDSDFGRIARQQRFIHELMAKATSAGTLLNVPKLFSLVESLASAIETDEDLSLSQMRRIAASLRNLTPERVDMRTVPSHGRRINGASYVVAKEAEAEALFEAFRDGTVFPDVGTEGPTPVSVADVPPLVVLNGVGTPGLAAQAQEALEEHGFAVEATGNSSEVGRSTTQVFFPHGRREEAALIAKVLPDAELVAEQYVGGQDIETDGPITIVLGEDFDVDELPAPPEQSPGSPTPDPTPTYAGATPSTRDC